MWNKILFAILLSLVLSFCASQESLAVCETPQSQQQIQISLEQYNKLKLIYAQLETKLQLLEQNSSLDKKVLVELQTELDNCNSQLMTAQLSLERAENSLQQAEASLTTLTEKINSIEHKLVVKSRQNRVAWTVAGALAIGLIVK